MKKLILEMRLTIRDRLVVWTWWLTPAADLESLVYINMTLEAMMRDDERRDGTLPPWKVPAA